MWPWWTFYLDICSMYLYLYVVHTLHRVWVEKNDLIYQFSSMRDFGHNDLVDTWK